MNSNDMINNLIRQNMCVGCGACVLHDGKTSSLQMQWGKDGFWVPRCEDGEELHEDVIKVCPFNPAPQSEVRTEDELSSIFLSHATHHDSRVGRYTQTYVGYSEEYRCEGSSGGMATYILSELFDRDIIDAALCVVEGESNHYEYKLVKDKASLKSASKTKYYPVTMASALDEFLDFDGRVAVVGTGCFIKSMRLLQYYKPEIRKKVVFAIGIICGGLKSSFFTDYLASIATGATESFYRPQYRIKNLNSTAADYSFGCVDAQEVFHTIRMQTLGDMWGTGLFKCCACDVCDDVTTELADVSLGDAWMHPYSNDGGGTNVIVSRAPRADEIIRNGIASSQLNVQDLDFSAFIASQQGSFNHRHLGLKYRMKLMAKWGYQLPPKRHNTHNILWSFRWVQRQRMSVRRRSLSVWHQCRSSQCFDVEMKRDLTKLSQLTEIYHKHRRLLRRINKLRKTI